jgi:hypothetical protein
LSEFSVKCDRLHRRERLLAKWRITGTIGPHKVDLVAESETPTRASSGPKVGQVGEEDLAAAVTEACEVLGPVLAEQAGLMTDLMASENKTGKVSLRRVVNEIYRPFTKLVQDYGVEAAEYGVDQALAKGVPNMNYAKKAAAGYRGEAQVVPLPTTRYEVLGRHQG